MSPAVGGTKREGRGPGHLSHGGHTGGSRVRDAPVWHNRDPATDHRSVRRLVGWGHCVTSARFGGDRRVLPVCASFVSQEAGCENPMPDATFSPECSFSLGSL